MIGASAANLARGDAGDVVDAGATSVVVHGVEADEVLLCVARHLCPRSRDDEVLENLVSLRAATVDPLLCSSIVAYCYRQNLTRINRPNVRRSPR